MQDKVKKKKKGFWNIFARVLLVLVIVSCIAMGYLGGLVYTWIVDAQKYLPTDDQLSVNSLTSLLYDKDGKQIDQLTGGVDRIWVSIDKIPEMVRNGFISIEDERFYSHKGVDFYRIFGAIWTDIRTGSKSQGGSTITQQYIKNFVLSDYSKNFKRKIQEQYLAIEYEKKFSKDQILEAYLNTINLGHGAYGVGAAAKIYFNKTVSQLSIAQVATIAALPQAPNYYDPYLHFDANKSRQQLVLKKMLELGKITPSEYNVAINENVKAELHNGEKNGIKHIHSYFVEAVIKEARRKLKAKGLNPDLVYNGGLKIYTTFDPTIQAKLDSNFNKPGLFPNFGTQNGFVQPESAMVITDYHTGEVKALIGGRGTKVANLTFNRATDSLRQPGSSIKPLAVYGPAIDAFGYNEYSTVSDSPFTWGNYSPVNDYPGYRGTISYKEALTISCNVAAVKVLQSVGLGMSYKYLTQNFKVGNIDKVYDKYSAPSLALGGLTHGVTVMDMTQAYGIIANKGVYVPSHTFTMIKDKDGNVLIDNTPKAVRVLKEDTATQLTDMLESVIASPEGTGGLAKFKNVSMPEAGKTGTTTADKDRWFVGFTPYYVAGVWTGYDNPKYMADSPNYSADAWRAVMEPVHDGLPAINFFETPAGVTPVKPEEVKTPVQKDYVKVDICTASGLKATPWCPPEDIKSKIFQKGSEPQSYCNIHHSPTDTGSDSGDVSGSSSNNNEGYNTPSSTPSDTSSTATNNTEPSGNIVNDSNANNPQASTGSGYTQSSGASNQVQNQSQGQNQGQSQGQNQSQNKNQAQNQVTKSSAQNQVKNQAQNQPKNQGQSETQNETGQ